MSYSALEAVVYCKDCKHWNRRECGSYGTCESENMNIYGFTDADWFCADGVMKNDETRKEETYEFTASCEDGSGTYRGT